MMDSKDLVFSIYVVDTPKGKSPAVVQHKDTNLLELEVILAVLTQSVEAAKMNYVIKVPPPAQQPPNPNSQPQEIDIQQIPEEYEEYQEIGTPDD